MTKVAAKKHVQDRLAKLREAKFKTVELSGIEFKIRKWSTNQKIEHGEAFMGIVQELVKGGEGNAIRELFSTDAKAVFKKYADTMMNILADTLWHENFDTKEEAREFIGEDMDDDGLIKLCSHIWEENLRPLAEKFGVKLKMPNLSALLEPKQSTSAPTSSPPDSAPSES